DYPCRVLHYGTRRGSGGKGRFRGGDGIRRDIQLLCPAQITILSDRRRNRPYGLVGGEPGAPGRNLLITDEGERELPGKTTVRVEADAIISIATPGGGGYGDPTDGTEG
ncbi:MAG: hydantoinase B/oxoprolinase family protein, partial [Acidobacteriota bacterium]